MSPYNYTHCVLGFTQIHVFNAFYVLSRFVMHIQSPKMRLLFTTLFFTISHSYPINPTIRPWWFAATTTEPIIPEPNQTNAPDSEHKINKNSNSIYVHYPGFGQTSTSFNWANRLWDSWLTNVFDI